MAESIHEQIAAAIETSLSGIQGDSGVMWWFTPGLVVRVLWFDEALLDSSILGPTYAIRPGEETHTEETTQQIHAEMDVFILLAVPFNTPERIAAPVNPSRWTVVNRMVRDVLRKLLVDVQLVTSAVTSGSVENIFATPVIVDRDRFVDGWAIAEIHFRVSYSYVGGVP